ncbi:MAG: site-2 protease family protein [Candidatus Latescibacter sp.]|nr:site-2 protease family protein [Candidatus Latescibacter sp.]
MQYRKFIIRPGDDYFRDNPEQPPVRETNYALHILLFLLTVFTTTTMGALVTDANPYQSWGNFAKGFPYSIAILSILGIHEFAHYFTARRWGIVVTPPYFIPAPIQPIGTFGAVISIKSSIPSRKALVDVGAAGPIAGFILAVIASVIGLKMSEIVPLHTQHEYLILGDSLLFKILSYFLIGPIPAHYDLNLHPIAFAGWIGLFITALNLLPIGQLDGGHILFALSPRLHELFRRIRIPLLLLLGLTFWSGWFVWALLSLFFGTRHPYPDRMEPDIGAVRIITAVAAIVIFILCIIPVPVKVG